MESMAKTTRFFKYEKGGVKKLEMFKNEVHVHIQHEIVEFDP